MAELTPTSGDAPQSDEHIHDTGETGHDKPDTANSKGSADVGEQACKGGVERGVRDVGCNCHVERIDQHKADEQECTTNDNGHDGPNEDGSKCTLVDLEEVFNFLEQTNHPCSKSAFVKY